VGDGRWVGERGGAWVARGLEARVRPSETPGGRLHTCVAGVLGRGMLGSGPGSTPSSFETKAADDADVFDVCLVQQVQLLSGGTGVSASDIGELDACGRGRGCGRPWEDVRRWATRTQGLMRTSLALVLRSLWRTGGPSPGFGAFSSSPYTVPLCWVWGPGIAVLWSCL
jgi:hypothetical protein